MVPSLLLTILVSTHIESAISNHRIIRMDENTVTYYVKDYREKGKWKEFTISELNSSVDSLCMYRQNALSESDTTACYVHAARQNILQYAGIFLVANSICLG